jgi:hypothetical protein
MKKLIQSALEGLGDVDKSKRKFIKQAGALGAIAATPKAVRKMAGDVPVQKALKDLPPSIYDVPYFKGMVRDVYEDGFRESIDLFDDDTALEMIEDIIDDTGKSFEQLGLDPENITNRDLLKPEVMKEIDVESYGDEFVDNELDFLQQYSDEVKEWLDGDLETDDLDGPISSLIENLQTDYGLDKQQVFDFFKQQNIVVD